MRLSVHFLTIKACSAGVHEIFIQFFEVFFATFDMFVSFVTRSYEVGHTLLKANAGEEL